MSEIHVVFDLDTRKFKHVFSTSAVAHRYIEVSTDGHPHRLFVESMNTNDVDLTGVRVFDSATDAIRADRSVAVGISETELETAMAA